MSSAPAFRPTSVPQPRSNTTPNYQRNYRAQPPKSHIDPLPASYTYTQLLPQLVQQGLIQIPPSTTTVDGPPYPNGYTHCDYHGGCVRHSTEECGKLKKLVQKLIDDEKICFEKNSQPNVRQDPLPNHDRENAGHMLRGQ